MQVFKRDVLDVAFPMRLTLYQPLLFHEMGDCYGTVSPFAVTISSYFVDGTVLTTSNSTAVPAQDRIKEVPDKNFYRYTADGTAAQLLDRHRNRLAQMKSEGYMLKAPLNFEDYTLIEYRNLEVMLGRKGERK